MFSTIWKDLLHKFQQGDKVIQLLFVNAGLFLFFKVLWLLLAMILGKEAGSGVLQQTLHWFEGSYDWFHILTRPWTLITHMFLHEEFMHFAINMLYLYFFGHLLKNFIGNRRILAVYILSGLMGFGFYMISGLLFPGSIGIYVLGASAAVMGLVVASAVYAPRYGVHLLLLGRVELRFIAGALVLLDLLSLGHANTGGHLGHLGGALMGALFIYQMNQRNDWSIGFNKFVQVLEDWVKSFNRKKGPKVAYRNPNPEKIKRNNKTPRSASRQEQIDLILDKIKQSGYKSLTNEEKEFLFRASKDD